MRCLFAVFFGTIFGGALVFVAFQYHVIREDDDFLIVPKRQASLTDSYVDVRGWDADEWNSHPVLSKAVTDYGRSDLVKRTLTRGLFDNLFRSFDTSDHKDSTSRQQ